MESNQARPRWSLALLPVWKLFDWHWTIVVDIYQTSIIVIELVVVLLAPETQTPDSQTHTRRCLSAFDYLCALYVLQTNNLVLSKRCVFIFQLKRKLPKLFVQIFWVTNCLKIVLVIFFGEKKENTLHQLVRCYNYCYSKSTEAENLTRHQYAKRM